MKFGVSVYIPNRNHAATLGAAIYSAVQEQPIEVAVIDDASTDDSVAVADAAAMRDRDKLLGAIFAFNVPVADDAASEAAAAKVLAAKLEQNFANRLRIGV